MPRIPLGDWVNDTVDWLLDHVSWLFDFFKTVFTGTYDGIDAVLQAPQPLLLAGIFAVIAFWLRGTLAGLLTFAGFAFIDSLDLWEDAMTTLSLVLVATIIALVIAVPVGIWAARSDRVSGLVRPVLDFMQTLPAMIYLIPAILFFGTGASAGIVATLIFALAPGVRMTELGIRQVDKELVEAAEAFGTTPRDTLLRVQLPLALPTVMAGVNQVIMLGLSMAAIAGMVGTGGLGGDVNEAIGQLNVGLGSEAGVAIVILAIYLDRMTSALGTQVSPLGRRAAAKARASQGLRIWSYRPRPQIAVVAVVVLALVAERHGGPRWRLRRGHGRLRRQGRRPGQEDQHRVRPLGRRCRLHLPLEGDPGGARLPGRRQAVRRRAALHLRRLRQRRLHDGRLAAHHP